MQSVSESWWICSFIDMFWWKDCLQRFKVNVLIYYAMHTEKKKTLAMLNRQFTISWLSTYHIENVIHKRDGNPLFSANNSAKNKNKQKKQSILFFQAMAGPNHESTLLSEYDCDQTGH